MDRQRVDADPDPTFYFDAGVLGSSLVLKLRGVKYKYNGTVYN